MCLGMIPHISSHVSSLDKGVVPMSKYTLKIKTLKTLREPYSRINMCIVDNKGGFMLKSVHGSPDMFVAGKTDTVSFSAPTMDTMSCMIASQESGTWGLDEIEVLQNGVQMARFVWKRDVGNGEAACMHPYKNPFAGMTSEQVREMLNNEYCAMKDSIHASMFQIAVAGTTSTWVALGKERAFAFFIGSTMAIVYAYLLENEIDAIGTQRALVNTTSRMIFLFSASAALAKAYQDNISHDNSLFLLGLLGFMVYKASIVRLIK